MIILDMGTAGAALATLLAKAVPATVAFALLCRPENDICLNRRYMRLQKEKLGMILKVGLPTAIGGSTMQLGFLLMSKMYLSMERRRWQLMVSVTRSMV